MRVYLAGPMTGYPRWNFDAFEDAARRLREAGHEVWSPHERDLAKGFDPGSDGAGFDLRQALVDDVEAVLASEAVVLLPGWEDSPGALIEVVTAEAAGIPWEPLESVLPRRRGGGGVSRLAAAWLGAGALFATVQSVLSHGVLASMYAL